MEEQHKNEIYLQNSESERLQVEKDMGGAARARPEVYDGEIRKKTDSRSMQLDNRRITSSPPVNYQNPLIASAASPTDMMCPI